MIENYQQISYYLLKNFSDLKSEKFFIHSFFKNTINFTNKDFLFSLSNKQNLSPINISIHPNLFNLIYDYLQNKNFINLNFPHIDIDIYKINLQNFNLFNTGLEVFKLPSENSVNDFFSLCIELTDNSESIISLYKTTKPSNPFVERFKILHDRLTVTLTNHNLALYEKTLNEIAGFGIGLTPAGDDFLYGLLSTWKTFKLRKEFVTITEQFIKHSKSKFNLISYNYFKSLIDDEISPTLKNILFKFSLQRINREDISALLNHGHTSGADILTGIITAIQNR